MELEPFTRVQTDVLEFMLKRRLVEIQLRFPTLTEEQIADAIHCSLFNPDLMDEVITLCIYQELGGVL